ncbi:hypothetical protein BD779DRAFT_1793274 [Infundibulicybe gibba]|nr:hypothetical protein BD779DRAFT_1793274 [Infundibulicybe gibba]
MVKMRSESHRKRDLHAYEAISGRALVARCEGKQIATDRRSRLGADRFEELQMLKFHWRGEIEDWAEINKSTCECEISVLTGPNRLMNREQLEKTGPHQSGPGCLKLGFAHNRLRLWLPPNPEKNRTGPDF